MPARAARLTAMTDPKPVQTQSWRVQWWYQGRKSSTTLANETEARRFAARAAFAELCRRQGIATALLRQLRTNEPDFAVRCVYDRRDDAAAFWRVIQPIIHP